MPMNRNHLQVPTECIVAELLLQAAVVEPLVQLAVNGVNHWRLKQ